LKLNNYSSHFQTRTIAEGTSLQWVCPPPNVINYIAKAIENYGKLYYSRSPRA
jgi:hypothetical protein